VESDSTETLKSELINTLRENAAKAELEIQKDTPSAFLAKLITALYDKNQNEVVVLIDEYDAPVTSNMGNMEVAEANANVLHNFFATLKRPEVSRCIRFTFVTGITRYALTSMDSGANHLTDISLLPKYAGICGFTLEEFDSLFADRMDSTLANFNGSINGPLTPENLRVQILDWYNGYNWGGNTRILNPYSILNFFAYCNFQDYWLLSGRPSHLTAMINSRPQDFIRPNLESYVSSNELQKTELTQLRAVPVLFHSGYLTIDMMTSVPKKDPKSGIIKFKNAFSFRLPNFEVSSSYYSDCFNAIFPKVTVDELQAKKENLKQLILSKDAAAVAQFFRDIFTTITYHQKPKGENTFHAFVQLILIIMGFNPNSEQAGHIGRSDLCFELGDQVYCILELKYCHAPKKLTKEDINTLFMTANVELSKDVKNRLFASALQDKLKSTEFVDLVNKLSQNSSASNEMYELLAHEAMGMLSESEITLALAKGALKQLPEEMIEKILQKPHPEKVFTPERIDALLSKRAQLALDEITKGEYQGAVRHKAKDIIEMGMAVYGGDLKVKVLFGQGGGPNRP
jgi:hypothetical protein